MLLRLVIKIAPAPDWPAAILPGTTMPMHGLATAYALDQPPRR